MIRGEKPRIVVRKTNRYILAQYVESEEAQDKVIINLTSKELAEFSWPEKMLGSLKSLPAAYLTGYLLGKKMQDLDKNMAILDMGLLRNIKKSRIYSFVKGVIDSGIKLNAGKEVFPDEKRLKGEHMKGFTGIFDKVKGAIDKKFV